ncbi:phosphoglycerate mutase (2,3-diphosphoglycerate-independent) [Candidatus Uhrbacteria bacterium RIFOXYA2_FULL_40_9]|nr:MAG: 2,3-bisphosphoglycerate-independent phosphoglycerate mutase [Candidatus Uhrbacteria bacterium GW2011_GWF2_40_263]OGL93917.1 MAG: phosphoglycerate mutase (2,3-diphosphoglycerate-independent) [Candidatus Uhrbacteria bacterium RIFOXYA2_FULL_40_9]OGL97588.1 MAG: phosphoglycerate mutase (2,3-diphosphoglycerate-independent) [Candidatus Uhrbacteria bacterium RIFOXYB2_FULL_41_18]HBK35260.1 2,3-bisphosphoglycerate-independent phosphoglycerate mutase [Candidatus Uhrbacteria bacterium]HCB56107.1 2
MPKPIVLMVLDGFGIAPPSPTNAVSVAKKPFFDSLIKTYPTMLLQASGLNVGLPQGEVGNSEVGHLTIGSGILRYQSLPRINKSIEDGTFFEEPVLLEMAKRVKQSGKKLHLIGLIGNGGVHSFQEHLNALLQFSKQQKIGKQTFIHAFVDGRDTAKDVGAQFMEELLKMCKKLKAGQVATVGGRSFGMDRNGQWDRIQKAYQAIVLGESQKKHRDAVMAIQESYQQTIFDEEMEPVVLVDRKDHPIATVEEGDTLLYFNFRADRARELTQAIVLPDFTEFDRPQFTDLLMVTFTEYEKNLPVKVLFPVETTPNPLAKIFAESGRKQLHIAETEKYAHVTFFLNGMQEKAFVGEQRILIPSPSVPSYDQKPEMSALEVTNQVVSALQKDVFDFIAMNYANPDMVGHTGNLEATIKAVEAVDRCLARVIPEVLKKDGMVFVMADHGNAEELVNPITGEVDKEHNNYPAPFIAIGNKYAGQVNPEILQNDLSLITPVGILADVAPTILTAAGLPLAPEMTGINLLG